VEAQILGCRVITTGMVFLIEFVGGALLGAASAGSFSTPLWELNPLAMSQPLQAIRAAAGGS
jgi:hypothetical protein